MIIVVDGYNVLKQLSLGRHVSEQERHHFIHMLSAYRKRKKHSIILFFDGGPSTWPSKEIIAKVTVIYSGAKKTADAVIMKYLKEHTAKEMLLVSSDNELAHYADTYEIASIGAQEFYSIIKEALESKEYGDQEPDIYLDGAGDDLDALMEAGSQVIPQKKDDAAPDIKKHLSVKRSSKRERALIKILNKL